MLGAIIGDIVGSVYEFNNTKNYNFSPLFAERCSFTDDSILTCAVAEWLLFDESRDPKELEKTIVRFCKRYPHPVGGYGNVFSTWIFEPESLIDYSTGELNIEGHRIPYYSCGNGSAMRVSPIAWVAKTEEEVMRLAAISAGVTHNHPEGIKGAQAVALCIFLARIGMDKNAIQKTIEEKFGYDLSIPVSEIRERYSWEGMYGKGDSGTCQDSVPQAISCALQATDFEDAIRNAISIGGDSDTIGCIAGSIAEALFGIPSSIIEEARFCINQHLTSVVRKFAHDFGLSHLQGTFFYMSEEYPSGLEKGTKRIQI